MPLIAGMRWLGVALVLFAFARPGELPWLLGGHLALGCLVAWLFDHGLRQVQDDRAAPRIALWIGLGCAVLSTATMPVLVLTLLLWPFTA
jgi:hypothetical protein